MENYGLIGIAVLAVLAVLFIMLLKAPIKLALKLLVNAVVGFAILIVFNFLGGFIGVNVAINWLNAIVVGILGLPGLALILVLQWLSII